MRTDEPEVNHRHGDATTAQPETDGVDGTPVGPPPHHSGETTNEQATTPESGAIAGGSESTGDAPAGAVVLQRSSEEPERETSAASGFWDISKLTGSDGLSGILMAGGVLIIVFVLLRRLWRGKKRRRATHTPTPREQIAALRSQAESRSRIESFKIEAHEFTRQLAALLDTKAERLERLIADADDRLARMADAEHRPAAPPPRPSPHRHRPIDPPARVDPTHTKIYQLADAGMDPIEIARQTGQPTGQVELILALRG